MRNCERCTFSVDNVHNIQVDTCLIMQYTSWVLSKPAILNTMVQTGTETTPPLILFLNSSLLLIKNEIGFTMQ